MEFTKKEKPLKEKPLPQQPLTLLVNGQTADLTAVSPTMTLLHYLHHSGRTGTKEGCGDGDCGACTVAVLCTGADGTLRYQAMNSCLIPVGAVAQREIVTVEGLTESFTAGLTDGPLHPVQAAMVKTGGSQCGYCTPGFIMSLFAAYYDGSVDDIAIEGNLCRCTGYLPIRRAATALMQEMAEAKPCDRFTQRLSLPSASPDPPPSLLQYLGPQEQFYRPTQIPQVLSLLQQHPNATLIAGGTDLGLDISHQRRPFPVLVSLEDVAELRQIHQTETAVEIGAAVPLSQIQSYSQTELPGVFPSLDEMLVWFAATQVRNRATLGGNIATGSPIGDLPPVLLSLDATLKITGMGDRLAPYRRTLPLADFFKGYRQTDLQPQELIELVSIPLGITPGAVRRYSQSYKIGKRGTDDISIVAAAFVIDVEASGRIVHARLAYGGVAAIPARAIAIESALMGQLWNFTTVQQIKPLLLAAFTPLSDLRGSARYRQKLVVNLFEKFFVETIEGLEN
ncbi:MAG: xanthine dehydrogenase FeS/FAD binding subunit XdhA [Phormidesmis priestleyi Ana]|uniref:Xanthine dehydrogenase FeS/FAD binding subunit XdhA n=1 Tax=Phormidesmis priestleyi Ana TaxID=1666911 RepID=A0A0P8BI31_9CYAN|nr:MAG: xanthine dehydrogenase FeS/FAD binding subunit XdhA [Phormidesmis priestleyi Ana]